MNKKEIRVTYRQKRRALSLSEQRLKSEGIRDRFFSAINLLTYLHQPAPNVHTYLTIRRQQEADTWPIIHQLWRDFPQVRTWSSVAESGTSSLRHFELTPDTYLTEDNWGIPVPSGAVRYVPVQPDLVIVPLLALDQRGHRVGYGGGYYDRFLAETGPDCLKIGVSYFEPLIEIEDIDKTDIHLNGCITPERVWLFD